MNPPTTMTYARCGHGAVIRGGRVVIPGCSLNLRRASDGALICTIHGLRGTDAKSRVRP